VYVSLWPVWSRTRSVNLTDRFLDKPDAHVLDGRSSASIGSLSPVTAPWGETIEAMDVQGFRVSNDGSGNNKNKMIWMAGVHPYEHMGHWSFEGALDALFNTSAGKTLRDWFDIYVYPCVAPQSKFAGMSRNSIYTNTDNNDLWTTTDSPENEIVKDSIRNQISDNFDVHIDWHTYGSDWNANDHTGAANPNGEYTNAFETKMQARIPSYSYETVSFGPGSSSAWLDDEFGTNGHALNLTSETANGKNYGISDFKNLGEQTVDVLAEMLNENLFTYGP